jgi:molybdopterin-containing oxidoreductase family iron-sulfur binding subunit
VQPLIDPLYPSRSAIEVAALIAGAPDTTGHALVRAYWAARGLGADDGGVERGWRLALHEGVVPGTGGPARSVSFSARGPIDTTVLGGPGEGLAYVFRPDPSVYDGRFANNAWLQELPKPLTKLTWDNAALISPGTAQRLVLVSGDVVDLAQGGRTLRIPVWISPGEAPDTLTWVFARWVVARRSLGRHEPPKAKPGFR